MKDVILATYPEPMSAHLARARLEAEGIDAWVDHENFAAVYPLQAGFIGGVQLRVREEDARAAAEIVQHLDEDVQGTP